MGVVFGRKTVSAGAAPKLPPAPPSPNGGISGPLFNGIQYVGMVSPPGTFLEGMTSPMPCQAQSGASGLRFAIATADGPGYAFVFPDFASIWLHGEAAPRPQIPTEMIDGRVRGYGAAVTEMARDA